MGEGGDLCSLEGHVRRHGDLNHASLAPAGIPEHSSKPETLNPFLGGGMCWPFEIVLPHFEASIEKNTKWGGLILDVVFVQFDAIL